MAKNFHHPQVVENYDQHIRQLIPGYELVHLQVQSILKAHFDRQSDFKNTQNSLSRTERHPQILVVGCGTGYELGYLTQQFPLAHVFATDLSENMLQKAKENLENKYKHHCVNFILADTMALAKLEKKFDAVIVILVTHFIESEKKLAFFSDLANVMTDDALLLSFDMMDFVHPIQVDQLKDLSSQFGLTQQQVDRMFERLNDDFYLLDVEEFKSLLRKTGFKTVQSFTQILNFYGWIMSKK